MANLTQGGSTGFVRLCMWAGQRGQPTRFRVSPGTLPSWTWTGETSHSHTWSSCGAGLHFPVGVQTSLLLARGSSRQVGVSLLSRYLVTDQVGPGYLTQPSAERYTDTNPISDRRSASCVYMCSVCNESSAQCLWGQVSFSLSKQSVRQIYIDLDRLYI